VIDTAGSDFDTVLAVYTGSCGSLAQIACNDNAGAATSRVSLLGNASTTYYILAGGLNGQNGSLVLHLSFNPTTLANDQCSGAIAISTASYTNTQSTALATSTGDPTPGCASAFGAGV